MGPAVASSITTATHYVAPAGETKDVFPELNPCFICSLANGQDCPDHNVVCQKHKQTLQQLFYTSQVLNTFHPSAGQPNDQ